MSLLVWEGEKHRYEGRETDSVAFFIMFNIVFLFYLRGL